MIRAIVIVLIMVGSSGLVGLCSAQSPPKIITAPSSIYTYVAGEPIFNSFSSVTVMGSGGTDFEVPLAMYNPLTNAYIPIAASGWDADYSNNTLIVYLRKGLYWYNGSATIPFTAWDVYADFYIGEKAFSWNAPFLNASGVRVLNNYTIEVGCRALI